MIISHNKKFVFLRTSKTASSSLEVYLSQFCSKEDTITPLGLSASEDEDEFKKKHGLPSAQNFILKKKSFGLKNFLNLNFYNDVNIHSHDTIKKVLKTKIGKNIKNYFFFTLVRNPFDWIVSDFWWYLYVNNTKIDILDEKTLLKIFKDYLNKESYSFFIRQRNIISNKNIKIRVLKYENFNENIKMIKEKLNFEDEKISIEKIRFKNLNIKKKIIIDKTDERKIINDAKFFFNNYYSDTNIPSKYR